MNQSWGFGVHEYILEESTLYADYKFSNYLRSLYALVQYFPGNEDFQSTIDVDDLVSTLLKDLYLTRKSQAHLLWKPT